MRRIRFGFELVVGVDTCSISTQEAETGELSRVPGQNGLQNKTLFQVTKEKKGADQANGQSNHLKLASSQF